MKAPHVALPTQARSDQAKSVASRPMIWPEWARRLLRYFTSGEQIKVSELCDRDGKVYYEISDLASCKTHTFDSRAEAIAWIESGRP